MPATWRLTDRTLDLASPIGAGIEVQDGKVKVEGSVIDQPRLRAIGGFEAGTTVTVTMPRSAAADAVPA